MPPKKPASAKSKKPATDNSAEYLEQINKQQEEITKLQSELKQQVEERNFFQIERDKVHTLYEVANTSLQQLQQSLQAKDRQIEELVENHQIAVRVYQQKIKDVMYNNNQQTAALNIQNEQNLRNEEDFHRVREEQLLKDIESLKLKLKENQLSNNDANRQQQEQFQLQFNIQRNQYETQLFTLQRDFELKLKNLLEESELRRKAEIQEIENNKNNQIQGLIQKHSVNFDKMKRYYLEITNSNLELIKSLKDEVEEMKKKQIANDQLMFDIAQENKRLTQPLKAALAEAEQLKKRIELVQKENEGLKQQKDLADIRSRYITINKHEIDDLKTALRDTAAERDDLQNNFKKAIQDVKQVSSFREKVLENRIIALQGEVESLTTKYNETIAAGHLDGAVAQAIGQQTDNVLEGKNRNIRELSFELARVMRLYNEALRVCRSKMVAAGLNVSDMDGFRPFEVRDDL